MAEKLESILCVSNGEDINNTSSLGAAIHRLERINKMTNHHGYIWRSTKLIHLVQSFVIKLKVCFSHEKVKCAIQQFYLEFRYFLLFIWKYTYLLLFQNKMLSIDGVEKLHEVCRLICVLSILESRINGSEPDDRPYDFASLRNCKS